MHLIVQVLSRQLYPISRHYRGEREDPEHGIGKTVADRIHSLGYAFGSVDFRPNVDRRLHAPYAVGYIFG